MLPLPSNRRSHTLAPVPPVTEQQATAGCATAPAGWPAAPSAAEDAARRSHTATLPSAAPVAQAKCCAGWTSKQVMAAAGRAATPGAAPAGAGCCSCRVGRPPCRASHTCSRPAGQGGVHRCSSRLPASNTHRHEPPPLQSSSLRFGYAAKAAAQLQLSQPIPPKQLPTLQAAGDSGVRTVPPRRAECDCAAALV